MVTGEDQHVFGVIAVDKVDVLVDGVGGTLVPFAALIGLVRGEDEDAAVHPVKVPGLAVADIGIQFQRAVLGQDADGIDAGVYAVGKREVDDLILAAEGNGGFRHLLGQDVQAGTLPACQQHCNHIFFLSHTGAPLKFVAAAECAA